MTDLKEIISLSENEVETEIIKYLPLMTLPDPVQRNEAEKKINEMSQSPHFFYILTNLYTKDPRMNMMVGILLRNSLAATDLTLKRRIEEKYHNSSNKEEIKKKLLSMKDEISMDCIAHIGTLELITNKWPTFFSDCQQRSLILCVPYLQDYGFDFTGHLDIILQRMINDTDGLIQIIEIFKNHLSQDRLNFLLQTCFSGFNIEGLTKLFDNFFGRIENKMVFINFVASQINEDDDIPIKFFEVLEKHNFAYNPACLFEYLNSDDQRMQATAESLLCETIQKIFSQSTVEHARLVNETKQNIQQFLMKNQEKPSFAKMIGCAPQMNKGEYYAIFVKEEAFWTLQRLAECNFEDLSLYLPDIVKHALIAIENKGDEEACALLQTLAQQVNGDQFENELSFCFIDILNTLVLSSERVAYTEYGKRSAIFSALIELIKTCSQHLKSGLEKLLFYLINKVKESLKIVDRLNTNEFLILEDILTWYVSLIEEILRRHQQSEYLESVYDIYYDILNLKKISSLVGDVYISLSTLITENSFFLGKMDDIVQFITRDIKYKPGQDFYTFRAAHLLIGDVSQVLSKGILKYSFLAQLVITNLGSDTVQRSLKPILLSILGDLIFAMGTSFTYKDLTCAMLQEIINLDRNMDIVFIDELRRSATILLDTLLITFEREVNENLILQFFTKILKEDDRYHCTSQLIDLGLDFASIYGAVSQKEILLYIVEAGKKAQLEKTYNLIKMIE